MCLGTTKNVSCVPSVHPIAPIGPTIEANIIDQIPLFFRHPVFNIQIKIRCFVAKLSELYLRTLVDKFNIKKNLPGQLIFSWTLMVKKGQDPDDNEDDEEEEERMRGGEEESSEYEWSPISHVQG